MISERLAGILVDSFWEILIPGLTMTIPLTVLAFSLAMVIAVITAMIQFADIKVLRKLARFYIWVIRGTPLLVQLFVVFYGLPNVGILIDPFPAAVLVFSINEGAYGAETIRAALELPADHAEDHSPTGLPHCVSHPWQFPHSHGEGHLTGCQHYRHRDVHGNPADRGQNL